MKKLLLIVFILVTSLVMGQVRQFSTGPDYKKEIADFTGLIKKYPDSVSFYIKRAAFVYELNLNYPQQTQSEFIMKDVIPDLNKAISLQPNKALFYELRGEYKWQIYQDTTGALTDKTKAIELEPNNPRWLDKRGTLYLKLNDYDKACEDYTKGAEMGDEICNRGKESFCPTKKRSW
jgi:tetratricopeptide (TPR) repeat protein